MKKALLLLSLASCLGFSATAQWAVMPSATTSSLTSIHFFDAQNGICSGSAQQRRTSDGGNTWTTESIAGMNDYGFVNATTGFAAGGAGQSIKKTTNGGMSWTIIPPPISNSLWAVSVVDATTAYFVGTGGVFWKTTNGGASIVAGNSGTTEQLTDVFFTSATTGFITLQTGDIKKTTNAGSSWTTVHSAPNPVLLCEMYFVNANTGFVTGSNGTILKTTDGGNTWALLNTGTMANYRAVHFYDPNNGIAVALSGVISYTNNGGTTWNTQTSGTVEHLHDVRMLSATSAVVVGETGTILKNSNITLTLGVDDLQAEPSFTVYPNPVIDQLTIAAKGLTSVLVYDALGRQVITLEAKSDNVQLDCSALSAGVYHLAMNTAAGIQYTKFTK